MPWKIASRYVLYLHRLWVEHTFRENSAHNILCVEHVKKREIGKKYFFLQKIELYTSFWIAVFHVGVFLWLQKQQKNLNKIKIKFVSPNANKWTKFLEKKNVIIFKCHLWADTFEYGPWSGRKHGLDTVQWRCDSRCSSNNTSRVCRYICNMSTANSKNFFSGSIYKCMYIHDGEAHTACRFILYISLPICICIIQIKAGMFS